MNNIYMDLNLTSTDRILFTLLKSALHGTIDNGTDWLSVTAEEWKACYALAAKHGVMAVAWDGIQMLPAECQPPRALKLTWGLAVQKYEERYETYCRTAEELSTFYASHGIAMVQLKGVGLSTYYPIPSHREGGDIDIYTYSSDRSKLSDKEANTLADKLMKDQGIKVENEDSKHSNFFYNNISIENHKDFLNISYNSIAGPMNDLLIELLQPRKVELCDGKYRISAPSPEFNALFLAFHAGQHYCAGLRVHHLFDYACMIKKYGLPLSQKITDRKLLGFIHALAALCNELLGTSVQVTADEALTAEVCDQIMHPRFTENVPKNKLGIFVYKFFKFFWTHYKTSRIFNKSFFGVLWNSIVFHIKNPKTICMDTIK